jgi:hypothetical protein
MQLYDTEMDMQEMNNLLDYARKNMTVEQLDAELINWAVIDILKKQIEREVGKPSMALKKKVNNVHKVRKNVSNSGTAGERTGKAVPEPRGSKATSRR